MLYILSSNTIHSWNELYHKSFCVRNLFLDLCLFYLPLTLFSFCFYFRKHKTFSWPNLLIEHLKWFWSNTIPAIMTNEVFFLYFFLKIYVEFISMYTIMKSGFLRNFVTLFTRIAKPFITAATPYHCWYFFLFDKVDNIVDYYLSPHCKK